MHFRIPHLKMPVRVVLGAAMISMYLSGAVYAVFPHAELGKISKEVFLVFAGICFMALPICWALHFSEQVIRSVQHWKKVRHQPGQPFLLGDESVVIFSGWVEGGGYLFLFCIVCVFWICLLAFAAYLVSFGNLGSIRPLF
jgi:hypothetical protein